MDQTYKGTIVSINAANYGCTSRISDDILNQAKNIGFNTYTCCPVDRFTINIEKANQIFIGNKITRNIHRKLCEYTGYFDAGSYLATYLFVKKLKKIKPSIIHLHNIHSSYINLKILVDYLNNNNIKVVWTLHDCWAMTGRCAYFELNECEKWIDKCYDCEFPNQFPIAGKTDRCEYDYNYKKNILTSIKELYIVTPSDWLKNLVKKSYLKNYDTRVIYNGISRDEFAPRESNLRKKMNLLNKKVILAVASRWEERKGFKFIEEASKLLSDEYAIVLIGDLTPEQKQILGSNTYAVGRINDRNKMMEYYTMADVFLNPTMDDNFPTTNIESLACGTPVITFKTGGSPEAIDEKSGIVISKKNTKNIIEAINSIFKTPLKKEDCLSRADYFDKKERYKEYIKLYEKIVE